MRERIIVFEEIRKMKAMLIKDGGRSERTEAADPVIEPDDLRGNACRRSEAAHDLLYSGKKTRKRRAFIL